MNIRTLSGLIGLLALVFLTANVFQSTCRSIESPVAFEIRQQKVSPPSAVALLNFRQDPDKFVETFAKCIGSHDCHFLYLHYGKTGGTMVEETMFQIFPPAMKSCCDEEMLSKFYGNSTKYCSRKFSTFQVPVNNFTEVIIPTCVQQAAGQHTQRRYAVLATFREPLSRLVSQINQLCNKYPHLRDNRTLQICRNCTYSLDQEYWDDFVQYHDHLYAGYQHLKHISDMPVLTIESTDLTELFIRLHQILPSYKIFGKPHKANVEKTNTCNFGLTSNMIRGLRESAQVYLNLKMGQWTE